MTRLAAALLAAAAALLLSPRRADGFALAPPPPLGSTLSYYYISGGAYAHSSAPDDGTLSTANFYTFAGGVVTRNYYHWDNRPRAVVDANSRLWFLDGLYLRIMDFAGDSVTTVFPAPGAPLNVLSCNNTIIYCGAISICGADAGWTTLFISATTRTVDGVSSTSVILAVDLTTWAWTALPVPYQPWDCIASATSASSGTIYVSVNGGIQALNLATRAVTNLTRVLPVPFNSLGGYTAGTNLADGPLASAKFGPFNALERGDGAILFVADPLNRVVRRIDTAAGTVTTISGDASSPKPSLDIYANPTLAPVPVASALYGKPMSLAWDSTRQRLYIADTSVSSPALRVYDVASGLVSDFNAQLWNVPVSWPGGTTICAIADFLALTPGGNLLSFGYNTPSSVYQLDVPAPPPPPLPPSPPERVYPPDQMACGDVAHQLLPDMFSLDPTTHTFADTGAVGGWRWRPVKKDAAAAFSTTTTTDYTDSWGTVYHNPHTFPVWDGDATTSDTQVSDYSDALMVYEEGVRAELPPGAAVGSATEGLTLSVWFRADSPSYNPGAGSLHTIFAISRLAATPGGMNTTLRIASAYRNGVHAVFVTAPRCSAADGCVPRA